jgi:hypothetical protein
MPLLGLLAAGATGGYARGRIESEQAKTSLFRDMLDKEVANHYDMRRAEASAAIQQGQAYYKHGLNLQQIQAKTEADLTKNTAREESNTRLEGVKAGAREKLQSTRDSAAMERARFVQSQANQRTNATQSGANARKQADLEARQTLMEGKAEMASQVKSTEHPIDKSRKLKNNDVDMSSVEIFLK